MIGLAMYENTQIQEQRLRAVIPGVADRARMTRWRFNRAVLEFFNEGADGMTHWTSGCEMPL
jgi:hypothetical protein